MPSMRDSCALLPNPLGKLKKATNASDEIATTATTKTYSSKKTDKDAPHKGVRCIITTPAVIIPILDNQRRPLLQALVTSVLIDLVNIEPKTNVTVKVQTL